MNTTASPTPYPLQPIEALAPVHALTHADALLRCASAVAYESADQHTGQARHLALSVVHLVDMARTLVIHGLDTTCTAGHAEMPEIKG